MKKIINILSFLLIINLLILCNFLIKNKDNKNILSISYAKTAIHSNDNYNLILSILKDTNKKNLIKYADYINLQVIKSLSPDEKSNTYFILSLPENVSFIAIYERIDSNNYKYKYCIDGLSSIDNIYKYKNFLIIEQTESKTSDEFNINKYFQVFTRKNGKYSSVFKKNLYSEETFTSDDSTFKVVEKSSIDCLNVDIPRILCITTITKYKKSPIPNSEDNFIEFNKITQKETYQWDDKTKTFYILKTEVVKKTSV